jgi:hypothetical protein
MLKWACHLQSHPMTCQRESGDPAWMNLIAALQEKMHPHPLRHLRVQFRRMPLRESEASSASPPLPQDKTSRDPGPFTTVAQKQDPPLPPRENKASTKMITVAIVQDKLHPLRRLRARLRLMSHRRETGDQAGMNMITSLQEKPHPQRHLQVWLRPMPRRENEESENLQAQRKSGTWSISCSRDFG